MTANRLIFNPSVGFKLSVLQAKKEERIILSEEFYCQLLYVIGTLKRMKK